MCYPANVVQMLQGKMKWDFHAVKGKACISYWELNLTSGSVGTVDELQTPGCCKIIARPQCLCTPQTRRLY